MYISTQPSIRIMWNVLKQKKCTLIIKNLAKPFLVRRYVYHTIKSMQHNLESRKRLPVLLKMENSMEIEFIWLWELKEHYDEQNCYDVRNKDDTVLPNTKDRVVEGGIISREISFQLEHIHYQVTTICIFFFLLKVVILFWRAEDGRSIDTKIQWETIYPYLILVWKMKSCILIWGKEG